MNHIYNDYYHEILQIESDRERDLKIEIIQFQGKSLLRNLTKNGYPKTEFEEEIIWENIEKSENSNKKIRKKINEILLNQEF